MRLDGGRGGTEPFWSWTDLLLFLGLGLPALSLVSFALAAWSMAPLTINKALLLMIPQFLGAGRDAGSARAAVPVEVRSAASGGAAARCPGRDTVPSFAAGLAGCVSVLAAGGDAANSPSCRPRCRI